MNIRNRFITSLLLTISLILSTTMPVFAEEITDDTVEEAQLDSVEGEASICWVRTDPLEGFSIINNSDVDFDHVFTRSAGNPYEDVILTSFTNGYEEELIVGTLSEEAKSIRFYNEGTVTASDNDPAHCISIQGCDGHGEEIYINSNLLNLSDEEVENLKLGELIDDNGRDFYFPTSGFAVSPRGMMRDEATDEQLALKPILEIVHDDYYKPNQIWVKITFTKEEKPNKEDVEVPEWEQNGYKRELLNDNGDYIEVLSQNIYTGKKQKPVITVSYAGATYTSAKGGALKVKYSKNKNCGSVTATISKVKKNKSITSVLKGKTITFEITPITVSDDNIQPKVKNGTVKSIKVMTGSKYKKVPKNMWSISGKEVTFKGNYKGTVSINGLS